MLRNDSKLISLEEAVALIPDGANCSFSGFSETNNPMSFVRQMIRAGKKHLEVSGMGDAQSVELLCGAKAGDLVRVSNYMARNGRAPISLAVWKTVRCKPRTTATLESPIAFLPPLWGSRSCP